MSHPTPTSSPSAHVQAARFLRLSLTNTSTSKLSESSLLFTNNSHCGVTDLLRKHLSQLNYEQHDELQRSGTIV